MWSPRHDQSNHAGYMANLDSGWEFFRDYLRLLKLVSFLTKRRFLLLHRNHHCHLCCTYSHRVGRSESRDGESSPISYPGERISHLIIRMKKLLDSGWLRTVQFFLNIVQKRGNWMQKKVIKQAFWLVNEQRSSQIANQIFCFQIKRAPWMAQFWRNFFLIAWYACVSSA